MKSKSRTFIVLYTTSVLIGGFGFVAHLTSIKAPSLPQITTIAPTKFEVKQSDIDHVIALFNQEKLPSPKAIPPPPLPPIDPFKQLRRYRLSGVIESEGKSIIILTNTTTNEKLGIGDMLHGALLKDISEQSALFSIGNKEITITLKGHE